MGLILLAMGCQPAEEWVVSEEASPEFIEAVDRAREAWCRADENSAPCLPMRISTEDANIRLEESEDETFYGFTILAPFKRAEIVVRSHCPEELRAWTIAHEMGHAATMRGDHAREGRLTREGNVIPREERLGTFTATEADLAWARGE